MSIYTKRGDRGITDMAHAGNISKSDDRIRLMGEADGVGFHGLESSRAHMQCEFASGDAESVNFIKHAGVPLWLRNILAMRLIFMQVERI